MKRLSGKLTYANVVATLALFLVLAGGTAFAANQMLPKNSVGAKQIRKGAVTPAKLSKASKATLTGPAGATGPKGETGQAGLRGEAGAQGPKGDKGSPGTNLTAETPLASGRTETGVFAAAGGGAETVAPAFMTAVVNFVQPLPEPLDEAHVENLNPGVTTAHCPGVGEAAPGYFCAYIGYQQNAELFTPFEETQSGSAGTTRDGANAYGRTKAKGNGDLAGTWAVTAP